ncbi:MAG: FG-GAP-like repeat-containing protein [Gemmataceae bacterium]
MTSPFLFRPRILIPALVIVLVALSVTGYFLYTRKSGAQLPEPGSALYQEYLDAFQIGVAAVDVDQFELAKDKLTLAVTKVPQEPAAWANRGLLYLRHEEVDLSARDLAEARRLAPDNSEIETLLGLLAEKQGKFGEALDHLKNTVAARPHDVANRYLLATVIVREGGDNADARYQKLMDEIINVQPNNLFILKEKAGVAARLGDKKALQDVLDRFKELSTDWSQDTRSLLADLEKASQESLPGQVPAILVQFDNFLRGERGYTRSRNAVEPSGNSVGEPLYHFVRLQPPRQSPAPADSELTFASEPFTNPMLNASIRQSRWDIAIPVWTASEAKPSIFVANDKELRRLDDESFHETFPSGPGTARLGPHGVLALDWNNDFKMDLLLAGGSGLRFLQQNEMGTFIDVTAKTNLDLAFLKADYYGAWAADIDMDGDLDIVLAPRAGEPVVLRNNRDGTFKVVKPFAGVEGLRDFVWADFDNDGAPDAAMLDVQGKLHLFANERSGLFRSIRPPEKLGKLLALAVLDADNDGALDLLDLTEAKELVRISQQDKVADPWKISTIAKWASEQPDQKAGSLRLFIADLDNNGGLDVIATGPHETLVFLNNPDGKFQALSTNISEPVFAVLDLNSDGRLDLLSVSKDGQPAYLVNHGKKDYHWQNVRPRATRKEKVVGDNRINTFGIGGEVEVRSGLIVQKQIICSPEVHFGLGEQKQSDVLRVLWPNGTFQIEFETPSDQLVEAEQRLKGSCPFLFTYDGQGMQFVSDFMWSTPLGMYINAQDKGGFLQTTDWVKIRGDQLVPRDGYYDVRVTANLWETHYYDFMELIVVDHPVDTEMFVDERFFLSPTVPEVYLTTSPHPVAKALDENGKDVTDLIQKIDGRYLDTFEKGPNQGVAKDHWVEVDLGEEAPKEGPVWLLAYGFVHPTDSSINFAVEQGANDPPRGLVLEVPDGHGGWKVGRPALGFPAGKNKTILIRLDGIAGPGVARRFRLRTNMEVYWDALSYATNLDAKTLTRQQRLEPATVELRYRGILQMTQANPSSPELPHYDKLVSKKQYWRDLIGFYTRFGDVRELLREVDDRYVIMNAGDELAFRFKALEDPPSGWKRDFVWVCDGWAKDGDLNTRFSKTVLPLPAHDLKTYITPPRRLEDDPVYKRFPQDWKKYHTRYVTPHEYAIGLQTTRRPIP